ncbi:MAG: hypothetical protein ACETWM_12120 [Candidatus Lokiarchaeia archaeon]
MAEKRIPHRIKKLFVTYDALINELKDISGLNLEFYPALPKDIPMVRIGDSEKRLMFIARMHGDEPSGTEALRRLIKNVEKYACTFILFPMMNTYGSLNITRKNIHNMDITRDFLVSEEPEVHALKDAIARFKPNFILDLHNTNFITSNSKNPRGYLQPANDNESIEAALFVRDYLVRHGLADLIREDMLPEYFLNPAEGKHKHYRKIDSGIFVRHKGETGFKGYTSKLGVPHICVESPAKVRSYFFDLDEDTERYEKDFNRYVDFHYLSMLGLLEYLKIERL